MPAKAPNPSELAVVSLAQVGERIRMQRKALRVSAGVAADSAGMSRVTLHRIERGEPSVTMGAYLNAMAALGLEMEIVLAGQGQGAQAGVTVTAEPGLPSIIRLSDYPQLQRLAWHAPGVSELTPAEALSLYERNWRHLDRAHLLPREQALLNALVRVHGKGHLLV